DVRSFTALFTRSCFRVDITINNPIGAITTVDISAITRLFFRLFK
ncbi:unnamed protein product, partial [marine sediment metagenome]